MSTESSHRNDGRSTPRPLATWPSTDRSKISSLMNLYCLSLLKNLGHREDCLPELQAKLGQWVAQFFLKVFTHPCGYCLFQSFSAQSLLYTDLHSRLSVETISALMIVHMNFAPLYDGSVPCLNA